MASRASKRQHEIPNGDQLEYVAEKLMLRYARAIRRRMREEEVTQTELAERLNVSQAYVSKALNYDQNMTIRTLAVLAEALGMEWEEPRLVPKEMAIQDSEFEEQDTGHEQAKPSEAETVKPPLAGPIHRTRRNKVIRKQA